MNSLILRALRNLVFIFFLIIFIGSSINIMAQGVELHPGYITGTVSFGDEDLSTSCDVSAWAEGGYYSTVNIQQDGSYTLTVNTPPGGSREYSVRAQIHGSGGWFYTNYYYNVMVSENETVTLNIHVDTAILEGTISVDGGTAEYLGIQVGRQTGEPYVILSDSTSDENGIYSITIPAGYKLKANAYAKCQETGEYLQMDEYEFEAESGEIVFLSWSGTFPPPPETGTITGNISYSPLPMGDLAGHSIWGGNPYTNVYLQEDGQFTIEEQKAGIVSLQFNSYFNGGCHLNWPEGFSPDTDSDGQFEVPANGTVNVDFEAIPSMITGCINMHGTKTLQDIYGARIRADGCYYTNTESGYSHDMEIDRTTGAYELYLVHGAWNLYRMNFEFRNTNVGPEEYLYSNLYFNDYTWYDWQEGGVTISEGEVLTGYDFDVPTGTVTIKFVVADGSTLRRPQISGSMYQINDQNQLIHSASIRAYGSIEEVTEAQATFIGVPGTYTIYTEAIVNGSRVTFAPQEVIVIEGAEIVLEIDGPSLFIESPDTELYTYDDEIIVQGKATDDVGIESITLNGNNVDFESTDNLEDPNEVQFSVQMTLLNGPNKVEVIATDTAGKIGSDTRYVYKDNGAPVLLWTPEGGTVTQNETVTINGTASDDNEITKITINGLSVDFYPTANPNEVSFSESYTLEDGPNIFTVSATDNCKRTTTEARVITKADEDLFPPVFGTLNDIILEQESPEGTVYTLPIPEVTDDVDPSPVVESNAPAIFLPGKTIVTWTATDHSGNYSLATQVVTVVDTTPPVIVAPDDIVVEQSSYEGAETDLGNSYIEDIADPAPIVTNDAPAIFPLGETIVTWTATDAPGNISTDQQIVLVVDTTPPVFPQLLEVILEQESPDGTSVVLEVPEVSDICDINPTVTNDAPDTFSLGTTTVTWTAIDGSGNSSTTTQTITVEDTTSPELEVASSILTLWPPNHKYVTVSINITASDICDTDINNKVQLVSVTSDEPEDVVGKNNKHGGGDGNTKDDIVIINKNTVKLRAERLGGGDGRVYTFNYSATDASGNTTKASTTVTVPHNPKKPAIDSGIQYIVEP